MKSSADLTKVLTIPEQWSMPMANFICSRQLIGVAHGNQDKVIRRSHLPWCQGRHRRSLCPPCAAYSTSLSAYNFKTQGIDKLLSIDDEEQVLAVLNKNKDERHYDNKYELSYLPKMVRAYSAILTYDSTSSDC